MEIEATSDYQAWSRRPLKRFRRGFLMKVNGAWAKPSGDGSEGWAS